MSSRGRVLVLPSPPPPAARPPAASSSAGGSRPPPPHQILLPTLHQPADPAAVLASSYGAISFSGPATHINASVTYGKVQCTGSMSTGERTISYAGAGKIDLELGLSTTDDQGQRLNDLYRITLHCPSDGSSEQRSLADIANTAYQPGGRVTQASRTGGLQGPERLKGVWRANGESFSWDLCRANCRPPGS